MTSGEGTGRGKWSAASPRASGRGESAVISQLEELATADIPEQEFLDDAVRLVCVALHAPLAKILELDGSAHALLVRSGTGWPEGVVGCTTIPATSLSQAGHTIGYREAVVFDDISGTRRFADAGFLRSHGVKSSLGVTIADSDRSLGVLGVHYRCRRNFTQEELRFVEQAAAIIGRGLARLRSADKPGVSP